MEPFTCFMEFRSYIDELYSNDYQKCQEAMICLKNAVIGSNKQKASVVSQGIVPRLITLLTDETVPLELRCDAGIVIGSLAKGANDQVRQLILYGTIHVLLQLIMKKNSEKQLVEICLRALRSIYQYRYAPTDVLHSNNGTLTYLIADLASPSSSIECQSCIANILVPICHSYIEQMLLCQAGAIPLLARLITSNHLVLQTPALKCLASMCFTNRAVSDIVCSTNYDDEMIPDILTRLTSRSQPVEVQLTAARCLTYLHRSGSLGSNDPRIEFKTLPCLARLCTEEFDEDTRATAAETLAYLAEIDSDLQRLAAISNHLINSLNSLLQCTSALPRQGAFRCFASLGANDEDIRKRIIEMDGLMEEVLAGLGDHCPEVRLAAVRCLHSLSRSVQQLRTTFQDHSVWRPLMALLTGQPTNELLTVVTSTICNLLLEFSPAKEPMLESGAVEMLCELTRNQDPALRLNGSWALMNMAFQAEQHVKTKIINTLGTDRIFQLLADSDTRVIMKTLGLLRNLLSNTLHIDSIMSEHSEKVMQAVNLVLDSQHPSEVKEQALCIIGNIGAGAQATDYVMEDENTLRKLGEFLTNKDTKLQAGARFAIGNLIRKNDITAPARRNRLKELGILSRLEESRRQELFGTHVYDEITSLIREFDYMT
ncbi:armadillo repeat-containing protein 8-like isoform X3 [Lutzomyia longipalpis]|uniref:armadillo repeat-containing protein 8-like isoform X3 n=1 Tax=Lutzomyia longipalpis TaxID=7200 RepID=UPI002483CFAA|nr:armadillo repeat-containing protein 8-like isoform X3 [Lutzomyia longipalpis]